MPGDLSAAVRQQAAGCDLVEVQDRVEGGVPGVDGDGVVGVEQTVQPIQVSLWLPPPANPRLPG